MLLVEHVLLGGPLINASARLLQSVQKAANEEDALAMVGRELDPRLEPFTSLEERAHLYPAVFNRLVKVTPERTLLKKEDVCGVIDCKRPTHAKFESLHSDLFVGLLHEKNLGRTLHTCSIDCRRHLLICNKEVKEDHGDRR